MKMVSQVILNEVPDVRAHNVVLGCSGSQLCPEQGGRGLSLLNTELVLLVVIREMVL